MQHSKKQDVTRQIHIAIGSAALICSLGYVSGAFADDFENVKKVNDIIGFLDKTLNTTNTKGGLTLGIKSLEFENLVKTLNAKNAEIAAQIAKNTKNFNSLKSTTEKANLIIANTYKVKIDKSSVDAIGKVKNQISTLNKDIAANKAVQNLLLSKATQFTSDLTTSGFGKDLNTVSKLDDFLKKADVAGKVITVADLAIEASKFGERVNNGSTAWLEGLTLTLTAVESFQPMIPFFPTPSEVAREIIDLQIALKNRNKSFLNNLNGARQATIDLTTGDASIDKYILRKLQENGTTFDTSNADNFVKDINAVYVNLRKDYMVNHFNVVLKNFYDTQTLLIDEKEDIWSFDTDGKAMFKSFINTIDGEIKKLNDEDTKIWLNKGLATVANYAATSSALKLGEDLKKTAALSAEVAKLQTELAKVLAGNVNELATVLKDVDAKLKEYVATTTKPTIPVVKPTPNAHNSNHQTHRHKRRRASNVKMEQTHKHYQSSHLLLTNKIECGF